MREEPGESLGWTEQVALSLLNQLKTFEAVLKTSLSERWWGTWLAAR